MTTLSVVRECWNCDSPAPEVFGVFKYVAVEPNADWHPLCETCSRLPLEVAAGTVERWERITLDPPRFLACATLISLAQLVSRE